MNILVCKMVLLYLFFYDLLDLLQSEDRVWDRDEGVSVDKKCCTA